MTNTFANAKESVSDEQLKHVIGGTRVNSRPHAAEDHLIDHGDLHGAAAADGHPLAPPKQSLESGPQEIESYRFFKAVTIPGLHDSSGNPITAYELDVYNDGSVMAYECNGDRAYLGSEDFALTQQVISEAAEQGDVADAHSTLPVFNVVAVAASPGLPDSDGRSDAGERENTTWPLPSSPDGGH
jgi:hypothetical protein